MKKTYFLGIALLMAGSLGTASAYADDLLDSENTNAHQYDGVFVTAYGGPAFMQNTDETDQSGDKITKHMKTGYGMGIGAGYKWNMLRWEVAVSYLQSDIDKLTYHGADVSGISGDTQVVPVMMNFYWDWDFLNEKFSPYIGVGVGTIHFKEDIKSSVTSYEMKEDGNAWAYQGIMGVMYHFTANFAAYLDYRYLSSEEKSYNVKDNYGAEGRLKQTYSNNLVNMGILYRFG